MDSSSKALSNCVFWSQITFILERNTRGKRRGCLGSHCQKITFFLLFIINISTRSWLQWTLFEKVNPYSDSASLALSPWLFRPVTVPFQFLSHESLKLSFDKNWAVRSVLLIGTEPIDQFFREELSCLTSSFQMMNCLAYMPKRHFLLFWTHWCNSWSAQKNWSNSSVPLERTGRSVQFLSKELIEQFSSYQKSCSTVLLTERAELMSLNCYRPMTISFFLLCLVGVR